jgi:hypothetical protein
MKNKYALILLIELLSLKSFSQTDSSNELFRKLARMEYDNLKTVYADCIIHPCYGDSLFFKTWLDGLENEMKNDFLKASECYKKAILIPRFELSTYEVGYSLGRVEIQLGNITEGTRILKKYLSDADNDLNDEDAPWGLSDDLVKEIKVKMKYANELIMLYKKSP